MKKKITVGVITVILLLLLIPIPMRLKDGASKTRSMDDVIANEPHFSGTVAEVKDTYIVVDVDEGEDAYKSSDSIEVSLNVECKDSMTHFQKGDQVVVYYDGMIQESYPARVNKVYAITLRTPNQ